MLGPEIVETSMSSLENNVCEGDNSRDMIVITRQGRLFTYILFICLVKTTKY
jgi:hypothetical protein